MHAGTHSQTHTKKHMHTLTKTHTHIWHSHTHKIDDPLRGVSLRVCVFVCVAARGSSKLEDRYDRRLCVLQSLLSWAGRLCSPVIA